MAASDSSQPPPRSELTPRERIWQVVNAIPAGRVCTYGEVARLAGLGRGARQVGRVLGQLPAGSPLPWYRVINAQGKISLPFNSDSYKQQRESLEAEGVEFSLSGTVSLKKFAY
jgi:methylated-DNA-protein-cysteine methyltransferase-like protein